MEELILKQIETLEQISNLQTKRLEIAENKLKRLAIIESSLITFGNLSFDEQLEKTLILKKYL